EVARPGGLEVVPLRRCPLDELLEGVGERLSHAHDVVAQAARALGRDRGPDDAAVADLVVEVGSRGEDRRARPQGEGRRPTGQGRALAEALDLDAGAADVAVAQQA